jgi:hypothetical protein
MTYSNNFYFCQALWKNAVAKIKMTSRKSEKYVIVKKYMRLALLPLDKIDKGINVILDEQKEKKLFTIFKDFHKYFMKQWEKNQSGWCVYGLKIRTNNTMETYNYALKIFCQNHPNVYMFLDCMLDMVYEMEIELEMEMESCHCYRRNQLPRTFGNPRRKNQ